MSEEKQTIENSNKGSGWSKKIPPEILLSPGGMVIMLVVLIVEILGLIIPIPVIGFLIQLPFVIILYILLITIGKLPIKSLILTTIVEIFFPFLPTWIIRVLT